MWSPELLDSVRKEGRKGDIGGCMGGQGVDMRAYRGIRDG